MTGPLGGPPVATPPASRLAAALALEPADSHAVDAVRSEGDANQREEHGSLVDQPVSRASEEDGGVVPTHLQGSTSCGTYTVPAISHQSCADWSPVPFPSQVKVGARAS